MPLARPLTVLRYARGIQTCWRIYHLTLTSLVTVHYKLALAKVVGRPEVSYQLKHVCFIVDVRYMQHTFTAFIAKCKNYDGRHLAPSGHLRLNKPFTTCVTPFILGNSLICSQPVFILTISGLRFLQIFLLEFSINTKIYYLSRIYIYPISHPVIWGKLQ